MTSNPSPIAARSAFALLLLLPFVAVSAIGGESARGADGVPAAEAARVGRLLASRCVSCHSGAKPKGDLDLASLAARPAGPDRPEVWHRVKVRLAARDMPPEDSAQPTDEERRLLTAFCEQALARHAVDGAPDPGPLVPRRLNVRELANVFRDLAVEKDGAQPRRVSYAPKPDGTINLYGAIVPPAEHPCAFVARLLPAETRDGGFDTIGENLTIGTPDLDRWFRVSGTLLDDLFSAKGKDEHGRYRWRLREAVERAQSGPLPRGVPTRRDAVAALLQDFASRAFRRPATVEEIAPFLALYDAGLAQDEDFATAIRRPLQAILVSPRFVILWGDSNAGPDPHEAPPTKSSAPSSVPPATPDTPATLMPSVGQRELDDHELAARLALFLWSSLPDRDLTKLAAEGKLRDPQVLEAQVRRMSADRRVLDGLLAGFVPQWLQLDRLDRNAPDAETYPDYFRNNLAELMRREVLLFADAVLVEDRDVAEFLDADWGLVCQPLAAHYGLGDVAGKKPPSAAAPAWHRVKFADRRRGGVLTMGKVLVGTSQPKRTSPVHRGKWLLETVLGAPPPPPPADVDNVLPEPTGAERGLTVPQLLAKHRESAACAGCHRRIDPLGLALETFDPVGRWRDVDQERPIEVQGTLPDGTRFDRVVGLKDVLVARRAEFVRGFARQMLAYALGRRLEFYDEPAVDQIVRATLEDGGRFSRVVVEIAASRPFRFARTRQTADARGAAGTKTDGAAASSAAAQTREKGNGP